METFIQELKKQREKYAADLDRLAEVVRSIDWMIEHEGTPVAPVQSKPSRRDNSTGLSVEDVQGMNPLEAAKKIARANQGTLRFTSARRLLEQAEILQDSEQDRMRFWNLVSESPEFRRMKKRGHYQLVETSNGVSSLLATQPPVHAGESRQP